MSKENSNYKPINGRLARVNSDGNVDNVEAVCCVHCHKSS